MSTGTGIEWTEATWNPVVGCTPVSPGCLNCYAATMARRLEAMGRPEYVALTVKRDERAVFNGTVRCLEDRLTDPLHWRKPRRIFVNSMSDLFHEAVPFDFIDRVFAVMALCPQHTFQVLTKRPERMAEYLNVHVKANKRGYWMGEFGHLANAILGGEVEDEPEWFRSAFKAMRRQHYPDLPEIPKTLGDASLACPWPLPNVWVGASMEDQPRADQRMGPLLRCPAVVRFLSCEPLLGPLDLRKMLYPGTDFAGVQWVIVGGESGHRSRPCNVDWVRSIVRQCREAGVPCFVKQLGAYVRWDGCQGGYGDGPSNCWPDDAGRVDDYDNSWVGFRKMLEDRKGGDPSEWPEDLRVREWPETAA